MAYADYMHCAVCDVKVHYDGEVNYEYHKCMPVVLCDDCLKIHEIIVRKRGVNNNNIPPSERKQNDLATVFD